MKAKFNRLFRAHTRLLPAVLQLSLLLASLPLTGGCVSSQEVTSDDTAVVICHRNKRTITIPESQVTKHLDHGDTVGACG